MNTVIVLKVSPSYKPSLSAIDHISDHSIISIQEADVEELLMFGLIAKEHT